MKLFKMLPLIALVLSVSANSAFADVGKNDSNVEHVCDRVAAALIKPDKKTAGAKQDPARTDVKQEPANGSSAM